jgi:endonuclease YncB( thermonuclease family)
MLLRSLVAVSLAFCLASLVSADDRRDDRRDDDRRDERRVEHRSIRGRVVSVDDGDTCTVLDESGRRHHVSLYGVDAPEKGQPYWSHAKESLSGKIYGKDVRFDPVEVDSEGRNCGRVYVGDRHINVDQVREGYGWHHAEHENVREFAAAEREAREHHRGLWNDRQPTEPWKYRQVHRQARRVDREDHERERVRE